MRKNQSKVQNLNKILKTQNKEFSRNKNQSILMKKFKSF